MKRNLVDFTRGSQLLGHFGFMFAAGLKGPLIIAVVVIGWTSWWTLSGELSDYETYLVWMKLYAAIYGFMEFDPTKQVALETVFGRTITLPISLIEQFPPVARAWAHTIALMRSSLAWSALWLVPSFALFYWFAARFGRRAKERKHQRGAQITTLAELQQQIRDYNVHERRAELGAALGWKWRLCLPGELARSFPYRPSTIARVTYPWRLEQSHAMLIGTTGMGKTVALSDMIDEARARKQRAVIFDLTGTFIEHFYDARRDVILNPLDARCPQWSVFDDCRDEAEFTAAAEALVPHDGGGAEQFWVLAARLLFVEMCLKLRADGRGNNQALARELMTADLAQVHKLMRGTVADPITAPEAARMAESIRAVFNANAKALKLLPSTGPRFSLREWVEEGDHDGGMVFISARYVDMSVCSQLLTVWLDTAMNVLMTLERTRDLRMWFFLDELGALHRLPALEKGLQTARNYGGAIVTGIHAYAKLKEVYGENIARTLSSLARTKLILGTADRDSAIWCSDFIGHTEVCDMEEGYTYGHNNTRDAVSLTMRRHIEPLVMPDTLMNQRRLCGYIKFPDGFPAAPIILRPTSRPKRAEPFIRRAADVAQDGDRGPPHVPASMTSGHDADTSSAHPSSSDDGAGKRTAPRQGELALVRLREAATTSSNDRKLPGHAFSSSPSHGDVERGKTGKGRSSSVVAASKKASDAGRKTTLPKDAVVRAGTGEAAERDAAKHKNDRAAVPPLDKGQAGKAEVGSSSTGVIDPRRMMLEGGAGEPDIASTEPVEIGDLDIDI